MKFVRNSFLMLVVPILAVLAAACGSDPTPTPEAMMHAPEDVVLVPISETNGSGQSGIAMFAADGGQTDVSIMLSTGSLQSELVHIHSGTCSELGGVEHGLTNFVGGSGSSESKVEASVSTLSSGSFAVAPRSGRTSNTSGKALHIHPSQSQTANCGL